MSDVFSPSGKAGARSIPDMVITRLSPLAVALRFIGIMAMLFAFWYVALHPGRATAKDIFESRVFWIIALVFTPVSLWDQWRMLWQMIFHQGRAVWIEDGRLKFIDDSGFGRRFRSIEIADIRELSTDRVYDGWNPWGFPGVAIKIKDGRVAAYIMTLFLPTPLRSSSLG